MLIIGVNLLFVELSIKNLIIFSAVEAYGYL